MHCHKIVNFSDPLFQSYCLETFINQCYICPNNHYFRSLGYWKVICSMWLLSTKMAISYQYWIPQYRIHTKIEVSKIAHKLHHFSNKNSMESHIIIIRSQKMNISIPKRKSNFLIHFLCINGMKWMFYCIQHMCLVSGFVALCFWRLSCTIRLCGIENKGIFHREKWTVKKKSKIIFFWIFYIKQYYSSNMTQLRCCCELYWSPNWPPKSDTLHKIGKWKCLYFRINE